MYLYRSCGTIYPNLNVKSSLFPLFIHHFGTFSRVHNCCLTDTLIYILDISIPTDFPKSSYLSYRTPFKMIRVIAQLRLSTKYRCSISYQGNSHRLTPNELCSLCNLRELEYSDYFLYFKYPIHKEVQSLIFWTRWIVRNLSNCSIMTRRAVKSAHSPCMSKTKIL